MENLNFIGKKVVKKSGEVFNVVSTRFDDKSLIIVLDDGKSGYELCVWQSRAGLFALRTM